MSAKLTTNIVNIPTQDLNVKQTTRSHQKSNDNTFMQLLLNTAPIYEHKHSNMYLAIATLKYTAKIIEIHPSNTELLKLLNNDKIFSCFIVFVDFLC
eukprot:52751_1